MKMPNKKIANSFKIKENKFKITLYEIIKVYLKICQDRDDFMVVRPNCEFYPHFDLAKELFYNSIGVE